MGRPTGDLLLIVVGVTICAVIFASVVGLLAIELAHPSTDTTGGLSAVWDAAAFLAGVFAGVLVRRIVDRNGKD